MTPSIGAPVHLSTRLGRPDPARVRPPSGPRPGRRWSGTFGKLATHLDIAWDLDGTLIGHPASAALRRFILATPHIRHVIVTFRSRAGHGEPWAELAAYDDGPDRACFEQIVHVEDGRREAFAAAHRGASPGWSLGRLLRRIPKKEGYCRRWKGMVCHRHGLTALVDDLTPMVAEGCRRYGVALFHPGEFLPEPEG